MNILNFINEYISSPALVCTAMLCGIYFSVKLKIFSVNKMKHIVRCAKEDGGKTGISPLSSLSVALAGTLGVGNIAGVAVAISVGGAGAVFWMMVSAFTGAALKYCEAYLSVVHRKPAKQNSGGAPYYIKKIIGKKTAVFYAFLCVIMSFFSGSFIQMNSAATSLDITYNVPRFITGSAFAVICFFIAVGGIERVSSFTSSAMPLFCAVYAGLSIIAIFMKIEELPGVLLLILKGSVGIRPIVGGISGKIFASGVRLGMSKGIFSHEAGCGTSSFSHAASSASSPAAQGGMGIAEVLVDTVFFGGITAFVILLSPAGNINGIYDGAYISNIAYSSFFGSAASHILTVLIVFFAFATVICWAYYGKEAVEFILKRKSAGKFYTFIYCASLVFGAVMSAEVIWLSSDIICSVMLVINCACLFKARNMIE